MLPYNKHLPNPGRRLAALLLFTSVVAASLVFIRNEVTGNNTYMFLLWNLFLAWIPFGISSLMTLVQAKRKKWIITASLFCVWLLFFPNAPYILTDLVHLRVRNDMAYWYDFLIVIFFCFNSLFLGFASLIQVKRSIDHYFPAWFNHILILLILVLTSFGIYLGRFERYNSWDAIINPLQLSKDIYQLITNIHHDKQLIYIVFFLSLFLVINYFTVLLLHGELNRKDNQK